MTAMAPGAGACAMPAPAMGVPSMMPAAPGGFGFPPFMPPPFMMMWMQQMAMASAMACQQARMQHAQQQAGSTGCAAPNPMAPLPYPMMMGAGCFPGMPPMPMPPMPGMQPMCGMPQMPCTADALQQQQQPACVAPAPADNAAKAQPAAPSAAAPANAPKPKAAANAANKAGGANAKAAANKGGAPGSKAGKAGANKQQLAKAGSASSNESAGDTLLDVDFASFIDSFLLNTSGDEHAALLEGLDDMDPSDESVLVHSDAALSLTVGDDGVMDLLTASPSSVGF